MQATKPVISLRTVPKQSDVAAVRSITAATGYFSADEVEVAVELIEDRIAKGDASEYEFIFADLDGSTVGYASFGEIACTVGSYDLYWIAVHPDQQSLGIGSRRGISIFVAVIALTPTRRISTRRAMAKSPS
jgi:D-alanine-D-alanine ligase